MRALQGGIPRGPFDGRSVEGRLYAGHVRALLDRLGPLPRGARPTLQAWGVLTVDLERQAANLQRAISRRRVREATRIRRQLTAMRTQLLALERRLEEVAQAHQSAPTGPVSATEFARGLGGRQ